MRLPLTVALAALVLAGPTHAQEAQQSGADPFPAPVTGPYSEGALAYSVGINCSSIITGNAYVENQVAAGASQQASPQDIPFAGEVHYVRLLVGVIGGICGRNDVLPEFVLPSGVLPAVSAAHPLRARYGGRNTQLVTTGMRTGQGRNGGVTVLPPASEGDLWPLSRDGGELEIFLPVVASRKLVGIGSPAPNCPEKDQGVPCKQAGDHLQIAAENSTTVTPQTTLATVGLFGREPLKPVLKVKSVRTLSIVTAPLATVTLKVGARTVKTLKLGRSGTATYRYARALRRKTVKVQARATDGSVSAVATKILR